MKNLIQLRQGDVMLQQVSTLPKSLKKAKSKVLALGKTSGHGHVMSGDCDVLEDENGNLFLDVKDQSLLQHLFVDSGVWTKEHTEIPVSPGLYQIVQQVQYDPYKKIIEQVKD